MADSNEVFRIVEDIRRLLGRDVKANSRFQMVRIAVEKGPLDLTTAAKALGQRDSSARDLLIRLEADGFINVDSSGSRPRYSATELGQSIVDAVLRAASGDLGTDLFDRVLIATGRPERLEPSAIRAILTPHALQIYEGFGAFLYLAVHPDSPTRVAEISAALEGMGCQTALFRASRPIPPED